MTHHLKLLTCRSSWSRALEEQPWWLAMLFTVSDLTGRPRLAALLWGGLAVRGGINVLRSITSTADETLAAPAGEHVTAP